MRYPLIAVVLVLAAPVAVVMWTVTPLVVALDWLTLRCLRRKDPFSEALQWHWHKVCRFSERRWLDWPYGNVRRPTNA